MVTFPSDKEIEFFTQPEVVEFFKGKLKPKFGNLYAFKDGKTGPRLIDLLWREDYLYIEDDVWLPRPDQLIEILEEKGYKRVELDIRPADCEATISQHPTEWARIGRGPTPAIALAKCVVEVG